MSLLQEYQEAAKLEHQKEKQRREQEAKLEETSIAQKVLNKARAEKMRQKAESDRAIQDEINRFEQEDKQPLSQQFTKARDEKNVKLFKEYVNSARADHLEETTRNGILNGTLPFEDVQKVYNESIGDWNPEIKDPKYFDEFDTVRDFGYDPETQELKWYVNQVGDMDSDDFRNTLSWEQVSAEAGQGNISTFTNLWNKDYETPDYVEMTMPDGSTNIIHNDAWLKKLPNHKITEMEARIDAKRDENGVLVNPVNNYTSDQWAVVNRKKLSEAGFVESDYGESVGTGAGYLSFAKDDEISRDARRTGGRDDIYTTGIERVYSPEQIISGEAREDYKAQLKNFGGFNDEEIEKKLQSFDIHSMYDSDYSLRNKYSWLPGAINSHKYGINLTNKEGFEPDPWITNTDDRFRISSASSLVQVPGTDRFIPTSGPMSPKDTSSVEELIAYNENLLSAYPKVNVDSPDKMLETSLAIDEAMETSFIERTVNGIGNLFDPGDDVERKRGKLRLQSYHDEFNMEFIKALNQKRANGEISTLEARSLLERDGYNIPRSSMRMDNINSKGETIDRNKSGISWVDAIPEVIGHLDAGYWSQEQFGIGKMLSSIFTNNHNHSNNQVKWAFYDHQNSLTGKYNEKTGEWDRSAGAMSIWDVNPGEGVTDWHRGIGATLGIVADMYALRGPLGLMNNGITRAVSKVPKGLDLSKKGFNLSKAIDAGKILPRPLVVKTAEWLVKTKESAAAFISRMTGGRVPYTSASSIAGKGIQGGINKATKAAAIELSKTLSKQGTKVAISANQLGVFFGVHSLANQMAEDGVYNVKFGEALKAYGSGAAVGSLLPAAGAFGSRLFGTAVAYLGQKTGMNMSSAGYKLFEGVGASASGLGTETLGFVMSDASLGELIRTGEWKGLNMPSNGEYAHALATIAGLKGIGMVTNGFKNIEDFAFKKDKYKIKWNKKEREIIKDILKKIHPDKYDKIQGSDRALADAMLKAGKDVNFWTEVLNGDFSITMADGLLFGMGFRPKSIMKVFNVKYEPPSASNNYHNVKLLGPRGENIDNIPVKSEKAGIELRDKTRQIISGGKTIELPAGTKIDDKGNFDLAPKETPKPAPKVQPSGVVAVPKTKVKKKAPTELSTIDKQIADVKESIESMSTDEIRDEFLGDLTPKAQKLIDKLSELEDKKREIEQKYDQPTSSTWDEKRQGYVAMVGGKEVGFSKVRPLTKKEKDLYLNAKDRAFSEAKFIAKKENERIMAKGLAEETKVSKKEAPKTLSQRIDEAVIEREYGKDWKLSKNLEQDLNDKYGVDSVDELTKEQLRDFETDLAVKAVGKGFEVGSGPITPQNIKNAADVLIGGGRYVYNDLPKHLQKLGGKIGVNANNFKERFSNWSGETKSSAGKFFNKVWNNLKNFYGKAKGYIKEYLKNPKIGASIEEVDAKGKPLTPAQKIKAMQSLAKPVIKKAGAIPAKQKKIIADKLSSKDVFDAKEPVPQFKNVSDLSKYLTQKSLKIQKELGIDLRQDTPESNEIVAQVIASEIARENQREWNADGWYSEKMQSALKIAREIYPQMKNNPTKETAFNAVLAITSNGQGVPSNSKIAMQQYEYYLKNGKFDENFGKNLSKAEKQAMGAGKEMPAMRKSFKTYNKLSEIWGEERLHRFLNTEFTVRQLRDAGIKAISGETLDTKVMGSSIFGPKVGGAFFQNIQGNGKPLTMDLHFIRNMRRITGDLLPEAGKGKDFGRDYTKQLKNFKNAIRSNKSAREKYGITRDVLKDDAAMIDIAKEVHRVYERGGFKKDTILNKRAKNLNEHINAPKEAPGGGGERNRYRSIMERVVKLSGEPTVADAQAKIWFPQKRLYGKYGIKGESINETDYKQEFIKLAKERGFNDKRIEGILGRKQPGISGKSSVKAIQRKKFEDLNKNEKQAILESGKGPLKLASEKSLKDKSAGGLKNKDLASDFNSIEAGMLGFTPQNMRLLRRGLVDAGHFVYNDLPKYVKSAGEKIGITAKNFKEQYKKFESDPKSFGKKTKDWFKRVWAQMKNWFNKNRESLRKNPIYRKTEDAVIDYIKNPKLGLSIEMVDSKGNKISFSEHMKGLRSKPEQRRVDNRKALARIKIAERYLLGEKIHAGGGKYVQHEARATHQDLKDIQKFFFKQVPMVDASKKQITNLKQLFAEAQKGNPLAETMMLYYQMALSSFQTRQRAFDMLNDKVIAKRMKRGLDFRRADKKTLKEHITVGQQRKIRDFRRNKVKDPDLQKILDKNVKIAPKHLPLKGMNPSLRQKVSRWGYLINRTSGAFDKYERMVPVLPVYQTWIDYRDAKGRRDLYREELMEPMNKVLRELGFNDIRDVHEAVGQQIQNYRNGELEYSDLSEDAHKINNALSEIYENPIYQRDIAINRYQQYRNSDATHIPGVEKADLEMLDEYYDSGDFKGLINAITSVEGFIKENYTPQLADIKKQEMNSNSHMGLSKGILQAQDRDAVRERGGNALSNLTRKLNSDSNILFIDDIVYDFMKMVNHRLIPEAMREDLYNVMHNDLTVNPSDLFESGVSKFVGKLMAATLSNPTKWGRNKMQVLMGLTSVNIQDMPSALQNIIKESFGRGALNIRKSSTFLNADKDVQQFFMSNTSSQSALMDEYLRVGASGWIDSIPGAKEALDKFKGIYGLVDLSSRWVDFNETYNRVLPMLKSYKAGEVSFPDIRGRISFDGLDLSMQNRLLHEIDAGNMKYVALQIADYVAAEKSQFRYQRMERSLLEHSPIGRLPMFAQNYPLRFLGQFVQDFQTLYHGLPITTNLGGRHKYDESSGDWNKFTAGLRGVAVRLTAMMLIEETLNRMFGYRKKYGWGYRVSNLTVSYGGLLGQVIDLAGDASNILTDIFALTGEAQRGDITLEERDKGYIRVIRNAGRTVSSLSRKQMVGLDYAINIAEGFLGKDHDEINVIRNLMTQAGWDDYYALDTDEKRTWWQFVRKIMGGPGHTKEQAEDYQKSKDSRAVRNKRIREQKMKEKRGTQNRVNPEQHQGGFNKGRKRRNINW